MNCPACGTAMTEVTVAGVKLDACQGGCAGLWFDRFELAKVEKAGQSAGAELLDIEKSATSKPPSDGPRHCPRDGTAMTRHFSSVKRAVQIDECAQCRGVFLDAGELAAIETEYSSPEDRHKATEAYYDGMFDDQLAQIRNADQAKVQRARHIAHLLRFICPSYYIPGKQPWGAF